MNKSKGQCHRIYFPRKSSFILVLVFLFGFIFKAFPLAGPVELILNTAVPSVNEFIILENSPVALTLGTPKSIGYTYQGSSQIYLTITSSNPSPQNQTRMKHTELAYYIPYNMTFDYDGAGPQGQTTVYSGFKKILGGFNSGYNLAGTFVLTTAGSENYLEGDYVDTITFTFTAN